MACRQTLWIVAISTVIISLASANATVNAQVVRATSLTPAIRVSPTAAQSSATAQVPLTASNRKTGDQAAATEKSKPKSPEQDLVKQLLEAKFDRTAPAVLQAWSVRETHPTKKKTSALSASIANVYKGLVVLSFEDEPKFKPQDKIVISHQEQEVGQASVLSVDSKSVVAKFSLPKKADEATEETTAEKDSQKNQDQAAEPATEKQTDEQAQPPSESTANEVQSGKAAGENSAEDNDAPEDAAPKKEKSAEQAEESKPEINLDAYSQLKAGAAVSVVKQTDLDKAAEESVKHKVEQFERSVTLGKWKEVKDFLATLNPDEADKVYAHVLESLAVARPKLPDGVPEEMAQQLMAQMQNQQEPVNFLTPDDILQLSEAAPKPIKLAIKKPKSEDGGDMEDETPEAQLPPGVKLPPGVTIDSLPAETLAALKEQAARRSGSSPGDDAQAGAQSSPIDKLAILISVAKDAGHDFSNFVAQLKAGTTHFGLDERIKMLTTADLLMKGGLTEYVEDFLPKLDEESTQADLPALKIWAKLAAAQYGDKAVADWLNKAWQINQWIVAIKDINDADKDAALTSLIELSPKVDKDLGQAWINASFTEEPARGMKILSNLGTKSATMAQQAAMVSEDERLKLLQLQNKAVENMIEVSPDKAGDWNQALTLLAQNWLTEADTSIRYSKQNSRNQYMQIDMYGNYYWIDQDDLYRRYGGSQQPQPIKMGDLLEIVPGKTWQQHVSNSLHTQLHKLTANLYLRINEEDNAFPFIEEIATEHPEIARDLVHEFLRIWTTNHDPNTDRQQRNPYIYAYGFDQKAESIPLTRSKQERNLEELSKWVKRIRKMSLEDLDEELLARAYTTCHSSAEVFRLESVKSVFGELEDLKPETIAAICQTMRSNLASNWRDVRNQEAKQTNRREPEVQKEVLRGYDVAFQLADEALVTAPDSWQLQLAKACLMYDRNAYAQTVQKSSEFADNRDAAFRQFEVAADKYKDVVATLEQKDQSTDVYDYWFYAALGACDLGKITDKTVPDLRQYSRICEAIKSLPGNLAEIHMTKVANNMFTRMSPIKPEIKFRYLRGGFEIVGDHPRAWEAKNLYDYYKDLVSEIKLHVAVDGDEDVGHSQPFGIYVDLLHTSEIEREAGGFAKYVQNQNSMPYAFNYGRPTEDYRDKFTDAVNQALDKHFEILNVTFVGADAMQSVPAPQDGWRLTPYAYILLKPRGSEVDRIEPLKLDMDFLDTSGYVVIPIESPALVIDSSAEKGTPRPISELQVTQTLDERQADEGKLVLEISASAKGLVPDLDHILDLQKDDFEVISVDDQGVLPTRFDKDSNEIQILSDRSWTVEYRAKDAGSQVKQFSFGDAKLADTQVKFQRYDDADLVQVEKTVALEKNYRASNWAFLYWLIPVIFLGLVGIAGVIYAINRPQREIVSRFNVPHDVNPFTVLTLLKDIRERNGISAEQSVELQDSINRIEKYYFANSDEAQLTDDLEALAQQWVSQAR